MALATVGIMALALTACSGGAEPSATVTVTEQSIPKETQSNTQGSTQQYIDFVRNAGGIYAAIVPESDLVELGNTICDGYDSGLSEEDLITVLVAALIENDMADDNGTEFAAALLAGATVFLCSSSGV